MKVPTLTNFQNVGMHLGVCGFLLMLVGYIGGCQLTTCTIVRYAYWNFGYFPIFGVVGN